MQNTNPKKLRAELKDYLDLAMDEPIRIQKRSGESFILLAEDSYAKMQNEIVSLQRRLLSLTEAFEGNAKEYSPNKKTRLSRLKKKK